MRTSYCLSFIITSLLLILPSCSRNEAPEADYSRRKSPIAIAKLKHQDTYVKIVYGQPYKDDRTIFGDLVPYGEVWRTGANEATEMTTTEALMIGGRKLNPGTYSLFTIPGQDTWTVILNRELGLWGAFDYNAEMDAFRIKVPASKKDQITEVFTIRFDEVENNSTFIILTWDDTEVQIPVTILSSSDSTI